MADRFAVVCFINGDSDLIEPWIHHYRDLNVDEFWFILHGRDGDNDTLEAIIERESGMHVFAREHREFDSKLRIDETRRLIETLHGSWIVLADSDEFVQFPPPIESVQQMAQALTSTGADCLAAPMLHRITASGMLTGYDADVPLAQAYPLGAPTLYVSLGIPQAKTMKHPLFFNHAGVRYERGHDPPIGSIVSTRFQGTTHHYKWRSSAPKRVKDRASSNHTWAESSQRVAAYLDAHDWHLPTDGAFEVSTDELLRRGWLRG
ncbi:glycosyltransferase family 2 protein [Sorangium sp. So ce1128]